MTTQPSYAATPPRPRPLGSLVASAKRLTAATLKNSPQRGGAASWQDDAWEMYDLVGEQRFLAATLGGRMAQAKFYVGHIADAQTDTPEPVEDEEITALLRAVGGTDAGRGQMVQRLGVNLFVAGDGWLVGIPSHLLPGAPRPVGRDGRPLRPPGEDGGLDLSNSLSLTDLEWRALSVTEVVADSSGELTLHLGAASDQQVKCSPDDVFLIRVWRPHPRRWWDADSPTRSSLPVLRELVGLTMHISAQIDSRLAGAGLLIVPQSAQRALRASMGLSADPDPDEDNPDPFTEGLMEAMLTPISDRSNASALVPLVVTVPDEAADKFHHLTFDKPLDSEARTMRDEAIRRLALGQDAPPELLLGTSGMNHWGAWLVREDVVTTHIEPPLALICDAMTTQYLWPVLEQQGMDPYTAREYVVWYDVSDMVMRPNRAADALALYKEGVLSDDALRTANGFDEIDAPATDALDSSTSLAFEMVRQMPSLMVTPGLASLVEQIRAVAAGDLSRAQEVHEDAPAPDDAPTDTDDAQDGNSPDAAPGLPATADAPASIAASALDDDIAYALGRALAGQELL